MTLTLFSRTAEASDTCVCGTNEHLVVIGISAVFLIRGKLAWAVECFDCHEHYLIGDEERDALFGTGWRRPSPDADAGGTT